MKTNESMRVQKGLVAALVLVLMCLTSCLNLILLMSILLIE